MVCLVMEAIEIRAEPDYFDRQKLITVPGHQPTPTRQGHQEDRKGESMAANNLDIPG
jgi:hypothetical protein